ncbi:MAG: HAD-IG family 5'-nucleotidase [Legionellales bacterium]|nr:HAD-IG family 5'-nucleotidase [Legionellales bacterium]
MTQNVFVNRILNMKKIKTIGLDMDHTLIRYKTKNFEALVFQLIIQDLIHYKQYPEEIKSFKFNITDAIRGLVVDSQNGNILKLSRFGAIRESTHGTTKIDFSAQQQFYRSIYVDLSDPNYMAIDTSFSIAFCVLYAQLVDLKDKTTNNLPNYSSIARDVLSSVDKVHADGSLKQAICQNLDHFVIREPKVVEGIKRYIRHGKSFFILTNSEYDHSTRLLDYALGPFLEEGECWQDLFKYTITLANKPRFFYDKLRFLNIDPLHNCMTNIRGPIKPGIYQGGNARQYADDLGLNGDEILYIGDHIYGDILRLKKDCNWRTALVVEELGDEIIAQKRALPIEHEIESAMDIKKSLEEESLILFTRLSEEGKSSSNDPHVTVIQSQISDIDHQIAHLLKEQHEFFNTKWDRIFRAGAEESFFAYQVDRYACIYMEKLTDLLEHSPLTYFRAKRRALAHDET